MTQHLSVAARFIRLKGEIILNVEDISAIWDTRQRQDDDSIVEVTKIRMKTGDVCHTVPGHHADELWDILQLGSVAHLSPTDKLRNEICI